MLWSEDDCKFCDELEREIARLKARLAQVDKDALRYRWMRSEGLEFIHWEKLTTNTCDIGLDFAIDSKLAELEGEAHERQSAHRNHCL